MKSSISSFALSLVLLSTSATLTSAVPAPLPAATGYASNSEEAALAAEARAQLRPVWRPGPRLDEASAPTGTPSSSSVNGLSARQGPVFRRNAESKFQYRKRTSAGLAVVGNLAYGLGERDVASPFGISGGDNHVPLPVQMRVRREASLMERDDNEEEDWDCSEYDDDEDEQYDDADDSQDHTEQWSAPAPSSSSGMCFVHPYISYCKRSNLLFLDVSQISPKKHHHRRRLPLHQLLPMTRAMPMLTRPTLS